MSRKGAGAGASPPSHRKGALTGAEYREQRGCAVRGARRRACAERAGAPLGGREIEPTPFVCTHYSRYGAGTPFPHRLKEDDDRETFRVLYFSPGKIVTAGLP